MFNLVRSATFRLIFLFSLLLPTASVRANASPLGQYAPDAPQAVIGTGTAASCQTNAAANALTTAVAAGGTITFNCGTSQVIINSNTNVVDKDVVVDGGGNVVLSGESLRQLFYVMGSGYLTLKNISLIDGDSGSGGAIYFNGVQANGSLINVFLTSNNSAGNGGAIYVKDSNIELFSSSIGAGSAGGDGGAIYNDAGSVTLWDTTIINNQAVNGGGIYSTTGGVFIHSSAIRSNIATGKGGGLFLKNNITNVENSTFYDNRSPDGGGIYTEGQSLDLTNVTFNLNRSDSGGALWNFSGTTTAKNTIFANSRDYNNTGPSLDCDGNTLISAGRNIITDNTCVANPSSVGDLLSTDPELDVLDFYGGKTKGFFPLSTSPAISHGLGCPDFDQRGFPRDKNPLCDVGSMEYSWATYLVQVRK